MDQTESVDDGLDNLVDELVLQEDESITQGPKLICF